MNEIILEDIYSNKKVIKVDSSIEDILFVNEGIVKLEIRGIFPKVEVFNISHNQIKSICGLDNIKSIDLLYCEYNNIVDIKDLFTKTKVISTVKELNFSHNNITTMCWLNKFENLKIADLSNNKIDKIEGLNGHNSIREIYLDNNILTVLENCSNVNTVFVENNNISNYELDFSTNKIERLNIEKNPISNSKINELRKNINTVYY